jgi:channel protein (hemolysin III family)
MNVESVEQTPDDFFKCAAHSLGYLIGIAALPVLTLAWRRIEVPAIAMLLLIIVAARLYLVSSVRSAVSPARAKAVISWVDMAALFVALASSYTVSAYDSLQHRDGWWPCLAAWALAAFGCSARGLTRATQTWYSSTFMSRFSDDASRHNEAEPRD